MLKRKGSISLLVSGFRLSLPPSPLSFWRFDHILRRVRSSPFRSFVHYPSNYFPPILPPRCPTRCEPRGPLLRAGTITPVCTEEATNSALEMVGFYSGRQASGQIHGCVCDRESRFWGRTAVHRLFAKRTRRAAMWLAVVDPRPVRLNVFWASTSVQSTQRNQPSAPPCAWLAPLPSVRSAHEHRCSAGALQL